MMIPCSDGLASPHTSVTSSWTALPPYRIGISMPTGGKNAFQRTLYMMRWHLADCNKKSVEHLASVFHRFCVVGECVA